ncbi:isocitrate lyase/PEP mutase family protein [Dyella choica]|uniref:Isocitrate lyase/phosphoenolpyruvate mutase family protein n=1 Tax=Dyella choica TaxID=1927959 RepID=A0A3S0Q4G1_9GAMM|nr:isocitrate lyase/phosphoenolpyruvate mutase family protein [Dyella choica]RUL74950.1 isocitrate lyase/phosphoenolpyruvate mutase family protein [Dyella choica]
MNPDQRSRAEYFQQLHAGPDPLVLPNAWDAASARIIESAGAKAIATTSDGMAWGLGYSGGQQMTVQELLATCHRICRVVSVPVSVDIEQGYGRDAQETCELVDALIRCGVVGINIEDGVVHDTQTLASPGVLRERIAGARSVARRHELPLFINARIDTYFAPGLDAKARFEETYKRAFGYIEAGASGIFVPGLVDLGQIAKLAELLPVPLNIYAGYAGAHHSTALKALGVRRISLGCGTAQASLAHLDRIAREALAEGRSETMASRMLTVSQASSLFRADPQEKSSDEASSLLPTTSA